MRLSRYLSNLAVIYAKSFQGKAQRWRQNWCNFVARRISHHVLDNIFAAASAIDAF
jgi:hypothetical protein